MGPTLETATTGSLDIRPSKIPAPEASWFFPQTADFLAGLAVAALVGLFAFFLKRLGDDGKAAWSKNATDASFEALKRDCLQKIDRADATKETFPEEIWNAVRHFLSASGRLKEAKNLTASEFRQRFGDASKLPEIALLARDLSYAPNSKKTPEGFEKLKKTARSAIKSVQ